MLPLESLIQEYRELGLIIAVGIGFAFGFVLERAGFGNARKLAAQFYGHDMTVFKVMFSAIITASLGITLAAGLGVIDLRALSESAVSFTYLWPMLAGGLVLGAGFIISGYCPGTSVVASASGKVDGMMTFLGVIIGSVIYGEIFPAFAAFHTSGDKGHLFLYDVLGIPAPIVAVLVAAMAIAMFYGAEKVERIFSEKRGTEPAAAEAQGRKRVYAFGTLAGLAVLVLGTLAMPGQPEAATPKAVGGMTQETLAHRILDEPWSLRILDLRDKDTCAKLRIPGSECTPLSSISRLGLPYDAGQRDIVLVGDREATVPDPATQYPGKVFVLKNGFEGWKHFALTRPAPLAPDASTTEKEAYVFRAALNSAMTGRKPAPPPPSGVKFVPQKKKKKGGGCS